MHQLFIPDFRVWNKIDNHSCENKWLLELLQTIDIVNPAIQLTTNRSIILQCNVWRIIICTSQTGLSENTTESYNTNALQVILQNMAFQSRLYKLIPKLSTNCNFVDFNSFNLEDKSNNGNGNGNGNGNAIKYCQTYDCSILNEELSVKAPIINWSNCFKEYEIPIENVCICKIKYTGIYLYGLGDHERKSASDAEVRCVCYGLNEETTTRRHNNIVLSPLTVMRLRSEFTNNSEIVVFANFNNETKILCIF